MARKRMRHNESPFETSDESSSDDESNHPSTCSLFNSATPNNTTSETYSEFANGHFVSSTNADPPTFSEEVIADPDSDVDEDFVQPEVPDISVQEEQINLTFEPFAVEEPSVLTPTPVVSTAATWEWLLGGSTMEQVEFDQENGRWKVEFLPEMREYDYWKVAFPPDVTAFIVNETNKYARAQIANSRRQTKRSLRWSEVTENEYLRYFAIRIIMGIDRKPELSHYWSSDPIFRSGIIPRIMPSDRFFEIHRYLHFSDSQTQQPGDKLHKIRDVWGMVTANFQSILQPHENVCVDESLVKFRGRVSFKQFIPSKRNRFGVKTFSIVDQKTGFILNSFIYAGKNGEAKFKFEKKKFGYGGAIVLELCEPYFQKFRRVYCDNYFCSPTLAEELLKMKTYICGTLRANRQNTPTVPYLQKGECASFTSNKSGGQIQVEFWKDKRTVRMISTGNPHEMVQVESRTNGIVLKPKTVTEYNKNARGIDLGDMHMELYNIARKTRKWSNKMLYRLKEMSIFNAYVMMKTVDESMNFLRFRLNLAKQILSETGGIKTPNLTPVPMMNTNGVPKRLTERHFQMKLDKPRQCIVCSATSKNDERPSRSSYACKNCNVPLCIVPCFEIFHTKLNF